MREYILYVLLFFIPIGAAMVAFLKREGMASKQINVVVAVSLLIIITFPISMERLGSLWALTVYMIVVFLTAGWLFKDRNTEFMQLSGEKARSESAGRAFMAATNLAEEPNPEAVPASEDITVIHGGDAYGEGTATDREAQVVPVMQEVAEDLPDGRDDDKNMEEPAPTAELPSEAVAETSEDASKEEAALPQHKAEEAKEILSDPGKQKEELPEVSIIVPVEELPNLENDHAAMVEAEVDLVTEILGQKTSAVEESAPDTPADVGQARLQRNVVVRAEESEPAGEDIRVMENLDHAFNLKGQGRFQEAGACFFVAWDRTRDEELKYLLTVELTELYQETGQYSDALRIIDRFLDMRGHKFDIINKIKRQREFLSVLTQELNRLGLDGTPISSVPEAVRIKAERAVTPHSLAKGEVRT